jgi:transglutaminase-like putative cysteine protease
MNTPSVPFLRESYPDGEDGIQKSLAKICEKVRESAPTPVFRSFAGNILRQALFPRTNKEKASAHFNHCKRSIGYTHDPPGTELIQAAPITLCVEGAPVCIPIGDCDDFVTALASLCAASGLEVEIVRQIFGEGHQQHVICEVKLEDGKWFPLDATTPRFGPGEKAKATKETRMNPWKEGSTGLQAEFVGIGALPVLGLGQDGQYHELPCDMVLGPDGTEAVWYNVGQGVQAAAPQLAKPLRGLVQGLTGLADAFPDLPPLPRLTTKQATVIGGGIVAASALVAVIIRKVKNT